MTAAAAAAERVARGAYGRLVALLAARSGDIAAAEDALGQAFASALSTWPVRGVPDRPEAWLMAVAKNRLTDGARRQARAPVETRDDLPESPAMETDPDAIPDRRLGLMFACAHPAIDPAARTPLILQTVLGLDAGQIGRAFHVPQATMAQRLVRSKAKIKAARIGFALPGRAEMPARLDPVLAAIHGAYASAWLAPEGADLSDEAFFLAELLADLLPDQAEAQGLAALIAFSCARRAARLTPDGRFVPLPAQDPMTWDDRLIGVGAMRLSRARALAATGPYQIEAAIEAVHADRRRSGRTDWPTILTLSQGLMRIAPSLGAAVQVAAALAEVRGPEAGLDALDRLGPEAAGFQPALAVRAHLLAELGQIHDAREVYHAALKATPAGPVRTWLLGRSALLRDT